MGEGDVSVEKTVCAWAERICRLIAEATPGLSPRPGTPSALVNGLLSARQRFPETSRDPPPHRGQGTEALCASLQAFLPSGKGGRNKRRRPRPPGRTRQQCDGAYRPMPANGGSEPLGAISQPMMAALVRVERALQPLLHSSGGDQRRNNVPQAPLSARQLPTASFSTPGTPCATPRALLSTGIICASSRSDRISQARISPTNEEYMSEERASSASPELRIQDVEAPASASTAAPSTGQGQPRPCLVPSLNLGGMRKLEVGLSTAPGFIDDDASNSERSHPQKSPLSETPLTEQASQQVDVIDNAAVSGGAGPCIWGPGGPPSHFKVAAPSDSQPRLQLGLSMKPLQLPHREEADTSMNLPETSGRDSASSSCEVSPVAGRSGRSSASSGRANGQHIPEIRRSRNTTDERRDSKSCCRESDTVSQECNEAPLRRRREQEPEMEVPQRRREHAIPELAIDLGGQGMRDQVQVSIEDESVVSHAVEERINRVFGLLDKVDDCIAQQRMVSEAKTQEIETLMQETDADPELEAGCNAGKTSALDEDSSDSSSCADHEQGTLDRGNYL